VSSRPPKAVLLAAGLGTRLHPLTQHTPKCLLEIGGKPLIDYWFDALRAAGVERVLLNTHHLPEPVRAHIAEIHARCDRFRIVESYEPKLLGSAGTLAANPDWADDASDVLIIYADNLSEIDLSALLAVHRSHTDPFTMALFRAAKPEACGIAELGADMRIIGFEEKPREPASDLANAGVYALTSAAYREIAEMRAFDLGFDVLPRFVGRMRGFPIEGYHLDIGTLENLETARRDVKRLFSRPAEPEGTPDHAV